MKDMNDTSISMQYYSLLRSRSYKNVPAQLALFNYVFALNDSKTAKIIVIFIKFDIWFDRVLVLVKKGKQ
jgi:hypothetical protein